MVKGTIISLAPSKALGTHVLGIVAMMSHHLFSLYNLSKASSSDSSLLELENSSTWPSLHACFLTEGDNTLTLVEVCPTVEQHTPMYDVEYLWTHVDRYVGHHEEDTKGSTLLTWTTSPISNTRSKITNNAIQMTQSVTVVLPTTTLV